MVAACYLLIVAVMGGVTFVAYWRDKRRAIAGRWRVREATLHLLELGGGWLGGVVARPALRHKTRQPGFGAISWSIVAVHAAAIVWWLTR